MCLWICVLLQEASTIYVAIVLHEQSMPIVQTPRTYMIMSICNKPANGNIEKDNSPH